LRVSSVVGRVSSVTFASLDPILMFLGLLFLQDILDVAFAVRYPNYAQRVFVQEVVNSDGLKSCDRPEGGPLHRI
jgi:hypothetical protein